jgi:hypothetical protein
MEERREVSRNYLPLIVVGGTRRSPQKALRYKKRTWRVVRTYGRGGLARKLGRPVALFNSLVGICTISQGTTHLRYGRRADRAACLRSGK